MSVASARLSRGVAVTPGNSTEPSACPAGRTPAQGLRAWQESAASATQPLPLWVDKYGTADLDLDVAVSHGVDRAHALADPLRTAADEAKPDGVAERRRERNRGHVPVVVFRASRRSEGDEMGAGAQKLAGVDGLEARKRRPVGVEEGGAPRHEAADEVL